MRNLCGLDWTFTESSGIFGFEVGLKLVEASRLAEVGMRYTTRKSEDGRETMFDLQATAESAKGDLEKAIAYSRHMS